MCFLCVTCHSVVLCNQADTGHKPAPLLHLGGKLDWSCFGSHGDVVVVVDGIDSVVRVWGKAGRIRGGRADKGESRPLLVFPYIGASAFTCWSLKLHSHLQTHAFILSHKHTHLQFNTLLFLGKGEEKKCPRHKLLPKWEPE